MKILIANPSRLAIVIPIEGNPPTNKPKIKTTKMTTTKTTPKHTPGPWTLGTSTSANPHGDFEVFGADYGFYTTGRVAVVDSRAGNASSVKSFSPQTQRLTAEANARLIASSPLLLEALVRIAFLADQLPASDITAEIKQTAVSAIAKAQG